MHTGCEDNAELTPLLDCAVKNAVADNCAPVAADAANGGDAGADAAGGNGADDPTDDPVAGIWYSSIHCLPVYMH
jgi:hypothetical protein